MYHEGDRIEHYRILRRLGSGATCQVYLALDEETSCHVALKVLDEEAAANGQIIEAFGKEARLCLDLSHPNVVACLGANLEAKPPWIAFEYVVGTPLSTLIERSKLLDPYFALNLLLDVALGLAAAHQKEILHRDIKPQNILVTTNGRVKLIDFGAASAQVLPEHRSSKNAKSLDDGNGDWVGTRIYASPEQVQGRDLDPTSDLYSLALVFYEMVTGCKAIKSGTLPKIFLQHTKLPGSLPPLSKGHSDRRSVIDGIVAGMLAFNPQRRAFSSAVELVERLQELLRAEGAESAHQRKRRNVARLELAETDYWRALNLIQVGKYLESLILMRSLASLPTDVGQPYRPRIHEAVHELLIRLHDDFARGIRDLASYLIVLQQMLVLAKDLNDTDLIRLLERRIATLLVRMPPSIERLDLTSRIFTVLPKSAVLGLVAIEFFRRRRNSAAVAGMRLAVARACLDEGMHRKALKIASTALQEDQEPNAASRCINEIAASLRTMERAEAEFRSVFRVLEANGHRAQAINVLRKHLVDHPRSWRLWKELGDLQLTECRHQEAARSLAQAGLTAFAQGIFAEAVRQLVRALRLDSSLPDAFSALSEALIAQGRLPEGFVKPRHLKLAVYCQENIEAAALQALHRLLSGTPSDRSLLEALVPLAHQGGSASLLAQLRFELGKLALTAEDLDGARDWFRHALEASPEPLTLFTRIQGLPGLRKLFAPLEILRLRRTLEDQSAQTPARGIQVEMTLARLRQRAAR